MTILRSLVSLLPPAAEGGFTRLQKFMRATPLVPFTRDGAPAAFLSPAAKVTPLSPACTSLIHPTGVGGSPSALLRLFFASLAIVLLAACNESPVPPPQSATPSVTVVTIKPEPVVLTRQLPGRTNPFVVSEVRPQVTGIIRERLFTEGSLVTAGQALYQIEDASYRADYESAKAALARSEASLEIARLNAERAEELIKTRAVSQQEYDTTLAALRQAEAEVGVAKAQVARAAVELGYARIKSPIDGRIGKSMVTPGALVKADQDEPLTRVQQLDPIYVDLTQAADEMLELRREVDNGAVRRAEGIPVTIILDDGSRYAYDGKLSFSDVSVDPMTGSFALRVIVPNPEHLLMPGMYVRAAISTAVLDRALLVPQQGVMRDPRGNASVMTVNSQGMVEKRDIKVGRTVGDRWLVESGLIEGDRIIVEGLQKIQPGMMVLASEKVAAEPGAALPAASDDFGAGVGQPVKAQD